MPYGPGRRQAVSVEIYQFIGRPGKRLYLFSYRAETGADRRAVLPEAEPGYRGKIHAFLKGRVEFRQGGFAFSDHHGVGGALGEANLGQIAGVKPAQRYMDGRGRSFQLFDEGVNFVHASRVSGETGEGGAEVFYFY